MLIDTDQQFVAFLERCKKSPYIAIDTEFLREKTYYPKLCLLQMGIENEIAIVDPFKIRNLAALADVLVDPSIVKIFHACSQDVEILYHETGVVPSPIFDTQIAAAVLGKTQQASYSSLVSQYCDVNLPKKDSFTDWSQRPLSDSQIHYAADDVKYLPQIYYEMLAQLKKKNRLSWLEETFADLSKKEKYEIDPRVRYKKLKRVNQLNARQQAAAREFAAWRELQAQRLNIPRKWVVSDEQIVEACRREARTLDELYMVRGMKESLKTSDARKVLAALIVGLDCPQSELPDVRPKSKNENNVDVILDVMNALVRMRAREHEIAPQTLAPQAELLKLARGHYDDSELMQGWRYTLVGKDLRTLLEGGFALQIHDGNLEIISLHEAQ
ncbi:MAG: ribonuclease D [Eggerthellaceae bacterium]|nr:ribonuclease D [Eggerthellaceae bacterium]